MRTSGSVETVDEIDTIDFKSLKDFNLEKKRMVQEYRLCGMNVYSSCRCTRDWLNRYKAI